MDSTFSLSRNIDQLVPVVSSQDLAKFFTLPLAKKLQSSGSDLLTEICLAKVFGAVVIEALFASSFRNAVRLSSVQKFARLTEIVLEAGAGPSVQHSLQDEAFFSMMVQLSFLSSVYEHRSLATALVASSYAISDKSEDTLRYDLLLGVVRSYWEQTSGFEWELRFMAVEETLLGEMQYEDTRELLDRKLPPSFLTVLLKALPLLARWPKNYVLNVRMHAGLSTIIIWAYKILGISVEIRTGPSSTKTFGRQSPSIFIDWVETTTSSDIVLNRVEAMAKHQLFSASYDEFEDCPLALSTYQPIRGFGSKLLSVRGEECTVAFMKEIASSALNLLASWLKKTSISTSCSSVEKVANMKKRISKVLDVLFPGMAVASYEYPKFDFWSASLERQASVFPFEVNILPLLVSSLAYIEDMTSCEDVELSMSIDLFRTICSSIHASTERIEHHPVHPAFFVLGSLLQAEPIYANIRLSPVPDDRSLQRFVVVSSGRASVYIPLLGSMNLNETYNALCVQKGIPSRAGDRQRQVVDGAPTPATQGHLTVPIPSVSEALGWSQIVPQKEKYMVFRVKHSIEVTNNGFNVMRHIECYHYGSKMPAFRIRFGLRYLQDLYWSCIHIPGCPCEAWGQERRLRASTADVSVYRRLYDETAGPDEVQKPLRQSISRAGEAAAHPVEVAAFFGVDELRYVDLVCMVSDNKTRTFYAAHRDCCASCALEGVQEDLKQNNTDSKRLVAGLIF